MASSDQKLVFDVRRSAPILVAPAEPTPQEIKILSDIDDQHGLRFHIRTIQFYRHIPSLSGRDPAKVIRKALSRALVSYYPFAGRLREEAENRKLVLDCTGEGVLFVEADADVRLAQFGDLQPPFPCLEELIHDVEGSGGMVGCPLMLIQVTRLACGGFIFALRFNHTMADGAGILQFKSAVAEFARGVPGAPSAAPVWERHLLDARHPPQVTCTHREYDEAPGTKGTIIPLNELTRRSFFFGPREVAVLRASFPSRLRNKCSTFDIITGFLWRCRTIALDPHPDEEVRVACVINARKLMRPPLPEGYYGNVLAHPVAVTTAGQLCRNPLEYAAELVGKAKAVVTDEYMRSLPDFMAIKKKRPYLTTGTYVVSDIRRAGFGDIDFGWGKPVYGGVATNTFVSSFYVPHKNAKGEDGVVIPVCLQDPAMNRFVAEIDKMTKIAVFLPSPI